MQNDSFYETLGTKLRTYRKARKITLTDLSKKLNKSLATVSKYETGEIAISLEILIDWCNYLNIDISTLFSNLCVPEKSNLDERYSNHFIDRLYIYWFKGGENKIHISAIENDNSTLNSTFYFDIKDTNNIYESDFVYSGKVSYSDTSISFCMKNICLPYDTLTLNIPTVSQNQAYKIGLLSTITFYYQPVAIKCLISQKPITDKSLLLKKLQLSQEEIKRIKSSNFFIT